MANDLENGQEEVVGHTLLASGVTGLLSSLASIPLHGAISRAEMQNYRAEHSGWIYDQPSDLNIELYTKLESLADYTTVFMGFIFCSVLWYIVFSKALRLRKKSSASE